MRLIGVPLTVAGFVLALRAASSLDGQTDSRSLTSTYLWLAVLTGVGIMLPPRDHPPLWYVVLYRALPVAGVILAGVAAGGRARATRACVWIAVSMVVALQLVTPLALPQPHIDVWTWTQTSVHALLHGIHPYTVRPTTCTAARTRWATRTPSTRTCR